MFKVVVNTDPSIILFPLPLTEMEEVGAEVVVKPCVMAPGLTQFEMVPVKAKLKSVPGLDPAASLSIVVFVLVNAAAP